MQKHQLENNIITLLDNISKLYLIGQQILEHSSGYKPTDNLGS